MLPSELPRNPHDERAAALALLREDATAPEGRNRLAAQASAASPCSSSAACPAEETEAIDRWCEQFLIGMPRLTMRTFELTGRGLAAGPAGLAAGDAALRIPLRLVLTSKALPRHPLLDTLHEDLRLAIALLYEPVRDPDGPWAKYTPLLPSSPPSALGWTPAQLARMGATPLPQQVAELRLTLEAAYAKAFPALSEALPELLPPSHFTWPRFLWAYSMVETRGLVLSLQVPVIMMTAVTARLRAATATADPAPAPAVGARRTAVQGIQLLLLLLLLQLLRRRRRAEPRRRSWCRLPT